MHLSIILVTPQLGENIGSIARIMANFDFCDLRIVNPRKNWLNDKTKAIAKGGIENIKNAKIFNNIEESISDLDHIFACSARSRKMSKEYYSLKNHIKDVKKEYLKSNIGIMFGSERCGLLNEEIIFAKKIIYISTASTYPILNLSHAVAMVCYEYSQFKKDKNNTVKIHRANTSDLHHFLLDLKEKLDQTSFFKDENRKNHMYRNISNIFTRHNITKQEIKTLRGVVSSLYRYKEIE